MEVAVDPRHQLDRSSVERALAAALEQVDGLALGQGSEAMATSARLEELHGPDGQAVLRLSLATAPHDGAQSEGTDAIIEVERGDGELQMHEDLPIAAKRAVTVLAAKVALERDGRTAASDLLAAADPEIVLLALQWVADHHHRPAADQVATLLQHPDARVVLAATEVLGRVGTKAHVDALIEGARLSNVDSAHLLYMTLGRIGGARAEAFLRFAAENEEDPALAKSARRALGWASGDQAWASVVRPRRGQR